MSVGALTVALMAVVVTTSTPAVAAQAAPGVTQQTAIARAEAALRTEHAALAATAADEFHVVRTIVDPDGASHVRYSRTYRGLPVYGGDIVVHNRPDGSFAGSSVGLAEPLRLDITPVIDAKDAAEAAIRHFTGTVEKVTDPVLVIEAADGFGRLAYETVVSGVAPDKQTPSVLHVLVDAITGEVVRSSDEIETIGYVPVDNPGHTYYSGTVTLQAAFDPDFTQWYWLIDQETHGGACDMLSDMHLACNTFVKPYAGAWGDGTLANRETVAADAQYGARVAFDYFKNVHEHHGILGDGNVGMSRVHYGDNYENAFWNGSSMTFGDGEDNQHPYVTLDVVGHELTHGVTQALAGLIYKDGDTGGLNEATSDIFATMIEFYAANPYDPGDYDIGEKIDVFGDGGSGSIRYLYNPGHDGRSYSCWHSSVAGLDPHHASGPANHFFFNLAEGNGDTPYGYSPPCNNTPLMAGIGRDAAALIWFRALEVYFTSNTTYVNPTNPDNTVRAYTLRAAEDLYGRCSPQVKAVHAAWLSVWVPSNLICYLIDVDLDDLVVLAGDAATVTIPTNADPSADPVMLEFSTSGLPEGSQATFEPRQVQAGDKVTMTVNVPTFVRPGSYQVTVTATSKVGSDSVTLPLMVVDRR